MADEASMCLQWTSAGRLPRQAGPRPPPHMRSARHQAHPHQPHIKAVEQLHRRLQWRPPARLHQVYSLSSTRSAAGHPAHTRRRSSGRSQTVALTRVRSSRPSKGSRGGRRCTRTRRRPYRCCALFCASPASRSTCTWTGGAPMLKRPSLSLLTGMMAAAGSLALRCCRSMQTETPSMRRMVVVKQGPAWLLHHSPPTCAMSTRLP